MNTNNAQSQNPAPAKSADKRRFDWADKHGACRICDGELPYGHHPECFIYKQEQRIGQLQARNAELEQRNEYLTDRVELLGGVVKTVHLAIVKIPEAQAEAAAKAAGDVADRESPRCRKLPIGADEEG